MPPFFNKIFLRKFLFYKSFLVLFFFKIITNYDMTKILKLYRLPIIFLARIIFLVLIVVLNYFKTKIKDTIIEKNIGSINYKKN